MPRHGSARLQIVLAAAIFSTGALAIKVTDLSALSVSSLRGGIAAVTLWLLLRPNAADFTRRGFAVGLAQAGTMLSFVGATKLTSAAAAIFIQDTAPLYVAALGSLLLGERLNRRDVVCLVAFLVGLVALFVGAREPLATAPRPLLGNLLAVGASACWALTILGFRWLARDEGGERVTAAAAVTGNVIACVVAGPWLSLEGASLLGRDGLAVAWLGVFQVGVAYAVFTRAVRHVPAFTAALLVMTEPVLSAVWAWLFLGETLGPVALLGCATIVGATAAQARLGSA